MCRLGAGAGLSQKVQENVPASRTRGPWQCPAQPTNKTRAKNSGERDASDRGENTEDGKAELTLTFSKAARLLEHTDGARGAPSRPGIVHANQLRVKDETKSLLGLLSPNTRHLPHTFSPQVLEGAVKPRK